MSDGDDTDWRQCTAWLARCELVPADHKVLSDTAQMQDLIYLLKDGVILCHLLNRLRPNSISLNSFSQRQQMSQFVSTLNIKAFLQACQSVFGLADEELFDPMELFAITDFCKVLYTLSVLSQTDAAQATGYGCFITSKKSPEPCSSPKDFANAGDIDEIYDTGWYVDDAETIYDTCHEEEIYGRLVDFRKPLATHVEEETSPLPKSKRELCIKELVDTEKNYVEQALQMIYKHFMCPLKRVMEPDDFSKIFNGINELLAIHREFLNNLVKVGSPDSRLTIPDCFIMCKEKFLVYGQFCSNLTEAQETLDAVLLNPTVQTHVTKCQMQANEGRFKLRDLLSVPMQRVLKYHLLLKELVKHTEPGDSERRSLEKALDEMQDLSLFVNEVKRDNESLHEIDLLQKSIDELEMPQNTMLRDYGRMLMNGELKVKVDNRAQSTRHVFLFDHVLLMCKSTRGEKYCYKDSLSLKMFNLEDSSSRSDRNCCSFTLNNPDTKQVYVFTAKKSELKKRWLDAVNMAKDNIAPQFAFNDLHEFAMTSFDKPTICDVCRKLLRGVFFQGYKCKRTNMAVHKECLERAQDMTGRPSLPPRQLSIQPTSPRITRGIVQAVIGYHGDPLPTNRRVPLLFDVHATIDLICDDDNVWWEGELNGRSGYFPKSCVKKTQPNWRCASYESQTNQISRSQSQRCTPGSYGTLPSHADSSVQRSLSHRSFEAPPALTGQARVSLPARFHVENGDCEDQSWFGGIMSRDDAVNKLQPLQNGSYVVRISVNDTRMGDYSLSLKYDDTVKHMRIFKDVQNDTVFLSQIKPFNSILELVQHYQSVPLSKIFPEVRTVLLLPYKEALAAKRGSTRGGGGEQPIVGYCSAVCDFAARSTSELSMKRGDILAIYCKTSNNSGFWRGNNKGKIGYFPSTYVEELEG